MGKKKKAIKSKPGVKGSPRNKWLAFAVVGALLLVAGSFWFFNRETRGGNEIVGGNEIIIETPKGNIEMVVYPDQMPLTVTNFKKLVGSNFYNGITFHRVEPWVVQGGDPSGSGSGGPGWTIKLETSPELKNVRGAVAMARTPEPDSAGSQFYILKKDTRSLDGNYAVFGMVTGGMDVVDRLEIGDKMNRVRFK